MCSCDMSGCGFAWLCSLGINTFGLVYVRDMVFRFGPSVLVFDDRDQMGRHSRRLATVSVYFDSPTPGIDLTAPRIILSRRNHLNLVGDASRPIR